MESQKSTDLSKGRHLIETKKIASEVSPRNRSIFNREFSPSGSNRHLSASPPTRCCESCYFNSLHLAFILLPVNHEWFDIHPPAPITAEDTSRLPLLSTNFLIFFFPLFALSSCNSLQPAFRSRKHRVFVPLAKTGEKSSSLPLPLPAPQSTMQLLTSQIREETKKRYETHDRWVFSPLSISSRALQYTLALIRSFPLDAASPYPPFLFILSLHPSPSTFAHPR